jgi:hypothetical protein
MAEPTPDQTAQPPGSEAFAAAIRELDQAAHALDAAATAHGNDADIDLFAREVRDVLTRVATKALEQHPQLMEELAPQPGRAGS